VHLFRPNHRLLLLPLLFLMKPPALLGDAVSSSLSPPQRGV
jgi:hypothetical protein